MYIYKKLVIHTPSSHEILRTFSALWGLKNRELVISHLGLFGEDPLAYLPVDILVWDLDIACLAMNATVLVVGQLCLRRTRGGGKTRTYFCALIWNRTPISFVSSSTYSYTPAGQNLFSMPLYLGHSIAACFSQSFTCRCTG